MRYIGAILTSLIIVILVYFLDHKWGAIPPLGRLLSPIHGYFNDKEVAVAHGLTKYHFRFLDNETKVYFDDRMVPHIFAQTDRDAYFMQGYLHARDRLWQMEFQTMFAAGRLSEVMGSRALQLDKSHRRLGLPTAARTAVKEMLRDSASAAACKAYTAGVNEYISGLNNDNLPIEYKLLDYKPELWNLEKTGLLLKYMAKDLAGYDEDFERSAVLARLGKETFDLMYPAREDSLTPIIQNSAIQTKKILSLNNPTLHDSSYLFPSYPDTFTIDKPDKDNGSNNWAISGNKSKTGSPILCNDPHLKLGLPSLWYECQITTPEYSVYGVSLPGAPGVIIGFNENIAFGFTNAMRDVLDYYQISFKDNSRSEYLYNNKWRPTSMRIDTYAVKNSVTVYDTVLSTHFGPVIYDRNFHGMTHGEQKANTGQSYSVTWAANLPSNELRTFLLLNRAKNYDDYIHAISTFSCPGQNMIFACKKGHIAITQQGRFPAKWPYQGEFVMPGIDSTFEWQGFIPADNLLTVKNPAQGFVYSANQLPADPKVYPYFLGGDYLYERAYRIHDVLSKPKQFSIQEMMDLQNDNYNTLAHRLLPMIIRYEDSLHLDGDEKHIFTQLKKWDLHNDADSRGALVFNILTDTLEALIWGDELKKSGIGQMPELNTLIDDLSHNINFKCVDNIFTVNREKFKDILAICIPKINSKLKSLEKSNITTWGIYKNTCIPHLLDIRKNIPALSRLNLHVGGGAGIVNATKQAHGPSWRMIVSLTDAIEAYGVYPGGESGHPGNPFYDTGVNTWAAGKYFKLWLMHESESTDPRILAKWICSH